MKWKYPWKTAQYGINRDGIDYVAGDVHGAFDKLEQALAELQFDFNYDRLFCVGDLIDRGPQSERVAEFLTYPWFYSIAGNHEWMLLNCHHDKKRQRQFWFPNGGGWWRHITESSKTEIINSVEAELSALITLESKFGKIGLVHALPYPYYSWSEFCSKIESDQIMQDWALWQRDFEAFVDKTIADVDLVLCGHTPMDKPYSVGNLTNIDTGSGHQSSPWLTKPALTIVELAEQLHFHSFRS